MINIGIIGGGPAGLMTAITAKSKKNRITILETNSQIGKKLRMTGGGRCNITNECFYDQFLQNIIRNKKFIYSCFNKFDNYALMNYLENEGIKLISEDDGRVFPKSQNAGEIVDFFYNKIKDLGIDLKTNSKVICVEKNDKFIVKTKDSKYIFDALIIATGGKSYKITGSDGSGHKIAEDLCHKIIATKPVLVPIFIKDNLPIKALSFDNVSLYAKTKIDEIKIDGPLMINSNFITGPSVLKASSLLDSKKIDKISIDFFKDLTCNDLDKLLVNQIEKHSKKTIANVLKTLISDSLVDLILGRLSIDKNIFASYLKKDTRNLIVKSLKEFKMTFDHYGRYESAVVTRGGIDVREINPTNMMSKKIENLFFVGEIIDVDSLTGGYNLQIYLSMAFACGKYIKESL